MLKTAGGSTGSTYWFGADGTLTDEQSVQLDPTYGWPWDSNRMFYLNGHLVETAGWPPNTIVGDYYVLYDQLGSTRVTVDVHSGQVSTTDYYPFGEYIAPPSDNLEQRFTGKVRDAESGGLDYFGARYYLSGIGRFMSADWSAQAQPVPYAKLDDPQTLNLYAYVRNNPISLVDPDGHWAAMNEWSYFSLFYPTPEFACNMGATERKKDQNSRNEAHQLRGAAFNAAQQQPSQTDISRWKAEIMEAISNDKDAIRAYKKFGKNAKTVEELEAKVNAYLTKKWGGVAVAGTTSASGEVNIAPDTNPYTAQATRIHEGVHRETTLAGIAMYGEGTSAFNQWRNNPQNWAADEVKAYSAEIPYLKESLRQLNGSD